jgi:hypothetical protein
MQECGEGVRVLTDLGANAGKLDPDLEAMLKELGLLEAAPVFIKAGITWTVLLQFKKARRDQLIGGV